MLNLSASGARAETMAYGEAFDTLYRFGLASHTATEIGSAGRYGGQPVANLSGLTLTSDGTAYAVSGGLKALVRIDLASGDSTVVGSLALSGQGTGQFDALDLGMAADCEDVLWLSSGTLRELWRVDPETGATTLVGPTGHPISGLVANGNLLYGTGGESDRTFYRIDKSTGAATAIGGFGAEVPAALNSVAMSFDDAGTLWAVLNYVPPTTGNTVPDWSDLATIDPATGVISVVGPIEGPESLRQLGMKGFAIGPPRCVAGGGAAFSAPVGTPPWLFALAGLLVAAAAVALRRRPLR
jgi:hypothetical protein